MDTFHSVPLGSPDHHIRKTESFPQTSDILPIENHNQLPTTPAVQLLNDRDHIRKTESFPQASEVLPIESHNQAPTMPALQLLNDRDHVRKTESFPQISEELPIKIHNQAPTTPALQPLNDRDHIRQIESFPQTSEVLPIEDHNQVPTAPVLHDRGRQIESFPQANEVLSIENHNQVPTAPALQLLNDRDHIERIESFPQTSEVLPIENHNQVPTAPALQLLNDRDHISQSESFPQTSEVLPIENHNQVPTAPTLQLLNDRDHIRQIESFPQTSEELLIESHDQVPTAPALQLLNNRDHFLTDIQEEDVEISVKLIDKPNPLSFPTLPEPMPLRKSTKLPRDPSMNAVLLGAATPGALVGGKRTSWLMKAREAKALDELSKKSHHPPGMGSDVGASSSLTFQGTKRKSDPFSLSQVGIRDDERPLKFAKTSEGEMESRSQPPVIVESAQEGVFDRLKKVVEDLGIRVGQTVGMSVGSDTATVLAEARAAAKAKVAERDRNLKEEELTMALPAAPETVEQKTVASQPPHSESPPLQDEETSRLLSSANTKGKQPDVMKVLQMAAVAAKKVKSYRWRVVVLKLIIRFFLSFLI